MFDHATVIDAFRKLDAKACLEALGADGLKDYAVAYRFLSALRTSGCLVQRMPNEVREAKRDLFLDQLEQLFSESSSASVKSEFEAHVNDVKAAERAFRKVYNTLGMSKIGNLPPELQAWGMISRTVSEFEHLYGYLFQSIKKQAELQEGPFDPTQFRLKDENGRALEPNNIVTEFVQSLGTTLAFLGHQNGWFEHKTNELILPPEQTVDDDIRFKAGTHTLLSLQWLHLERAWDRAKFFETHLEIQERSYAQANNESRIVEVLVAGNPLEFEVVDQISQNRLEQIGAEYSIGMSNAGAPRFNLSHAIPCGLPPSEYISLAEEVATSVLMDVYCVPVDDDTQLFAGLSLKAWVRGYALYERLANQDSGKPIFDCRSFTYSQLAERLQMVGLNSGQADKFIRLTTFQQSVIDLYDAPLLRVDDGSYRLFCPAFFNPVIARILLSRLSSINRDGKPVQFFDKGKRFESKVLELFRGIGVPAVSFAYDIAGQRYDCDVAVILGDTLFVFECKNYNLPHSRISELRHFIQALGDSGEQVSRIAKQLGDNPDLVRVHLGKDAKWTKIVPCVLHAMPWSMGSDGTVCFYDQSALTRFLRDGWVGMRHFSNTPYSTTSSKRVKIRNDVIPTQEELLREMQNPVQVRFHSGGWFLESNTVPIAADFYVEIPEWRRNPVSLEDQAKALGIKIENNVDFPNGADVQTASLIAEVFGELLEDSDAPKQGRNDLCKCGSGKKFKRCCGK